VPAAQSGVASAMNTVARMVSGALGVAVIGSLVSSVYSREVDGAFVGVPLDAQTAAEGSVGAASAIGARLAPDASSGFLVTSGDAFTHAMGLGLLVAAAIAAAMAAIVLRFLPEERVVAEAEPTAAPLATSGRVA